MATPLTIIDVGHAAGVILPQQVLDRLHLGLGDTLCLIETAQGFELRPEDTELAGKWKSPSASCSRTTISCASWPTNPPVP